MCLYVRVFVFNYGMYVRVSVYVSVCVLHVSCMCSCVFMSLSLSVRLYAYTDVGLCNLCYTCRVCYVYCVCSCMDEYMYACMTGCMYVYVCLGALSGVVSLLYVCVMSNVLQCTVESIYIYIHIINCIAIKNV